MDRGGEDFTTATFEAWDGERTRRLGFVLVVVKCSGDSVSPPPRRRPVHPKKPQSDDDDEASRERSSSAKNVLLPRAPARSPPPRRSPPPNALVPCRRSERRLHPHLFLYTTLCLSLIYASALHTQRGNIVHLIVHLTFSQFHSPFMFLTSHPSNPRYIQTTNPNSR